MQPTAEQDATVVAPEHLRRAKLAYSLHLVPRQALCCTLAPSPDAVPRAGDLVLARVEEVGQHDRLELPDGRRATLFPGDEVVVVYGSCCAPEQYEADVPTDLGPCELVTGSGVAGHTLAAHAKMGSPTRLSPLGLVADTDGSRLNLADWRLPHLPPPHVDRRPTTLAVVGTAHRSGSGAAAAALVHGLVRGGRRVGAAKVTGTGGEDVWMLADGGAVPVLDVTHAGRPSTYRIGNAGLADVFQTLGGHLAAAPVDVVVLVMAQTVFDAETAALLAGPEVAGGTDGIVFAAADALSALAGVARLEDLGLHTTAVVGGLSGSPLASREARNLLPHVPVLANHELAHPLVADQLVGDGGHTGRSR